MVAMEHADAGRERFTQDTDECETVRSSRLGPALCNVLKTNPLWRAFWSFKSEYLAPIEDSKLESTPQIIRTLACDHVEVRPSPGCGMGVFAITKIPANQFLDLYEGRLKTDEEVEKDRGSAYVLDVGMGWNVDAEVDGNWTRYLNHSPEPNVEPYPYPDGRPSTFVVTAADGVPRKVTMPTRPRVEMWTTREIQPGEELRFDYGEEYAEHLQEWLQLVGRDLK